MGETVEYHLRIRDLPLAERPRERLKSRGASALNNAELLAIILRTGTASESVLNLAARLLAHFGGLGGLSKASFSELSSVKGVGPAKAAETKAALELGARLYSLQPEQRVIIKSPQDIANLLMGEMGFLDQEELRVVLLNTKNQVIAIPSVYKGSVNTSLIRVAELFREAIRQNCPALAVVHNHPSGDPTPSEDDIRVTKQIVVAGKSLDIEVLDHLIISQQKYVSLKEKGLGFV